MLTTLSKVSGPGFRRAAQEAADARKQLVIATDKDKKGRILRVGYYLLAPGAPEPTAPPISWFKEGEIELTISDHPSEVRFAHRLQLEFTHPRPEERHLLIEIPILEDVQLLLRCLFRFADHLTSEFVIQAEIRGVFKGEHVWRPVVRFDSSHGFFHRDLIAADGRKFKETLSVTSPREGIGKAIAELRANLHKWLKELGHPTLERDALSDPTVSSDLDEAKRTLLNLFDHPESAASAHSTLVAFRR